MNTSDRGGLPARRRHGVFPLCGQWYLQNAPVDAAILALTWSGHLPGPPFNGLPDSPVSPDLVYSYRLLLSLVPPRGGFCQTPIVLLRSPLSAHRSLPAYLHACGLAQLPVFCFCADALMLTSDWW
jgi:hypothetical protein